MTVIKHAVTTNHQPNYDNKKYKYEKPGSWSATNLL